MRHAAPIALALTLVALAPIAHESWRLLCVQSRTAPPALRIADGPDEVHLDQIARLELRKHRHD